MVTGGDRLQLASCIRRASSLSPRSPKVDPDDDAMWRRIHVIPMVCQVPKHLRDPKVKALLRDPTAAGPAILQWLLKGCLAWQREGLKIPAVVQQATDDYRGSQDSFAEFVSDCCVLESDAWVSSEALRKEYDEWASERGEGWLNGDSLNDQAFAKKLRRFGLLPKKGTGGIRGWSGFRLDRNKPPFETSMDSVQ